MLYIEVEFLGLVQGEFFVQFASKGCQHCKNAKQADKGNNVVSFFGIHFWFVLIVGFLV